MVYESLFATEGFLPLFDLFGVDLAEDGLGLADMVA
jgi:hypothetical protein